MKILHTSDWHIGNFPGPETGGKNARGLDIEKCIQNIIDTSKVEKPDLIIIAGDIFHQARVWADRGLSEVKTAIKAIEQLGTVSHVVVLRGTPNHDGEEQFAMLESHFRENVKVRIVTKPEVLKIPIIETIGKNRFPSIFNVACLPGFDRGEYRAKYPGISKEDENYVFTEELGKIVLGLKAECNPSEKSIFVSHYTVPGCNTESGQTQFLAQFEPVILPEVMDSADFDIACLGHIHRPQKLESCRNTFYSGAINALNFNDEGQERGFWIHEVDIDTKSEFHLTAYREFKTIRLNQEGVSEFNREQKIVLDDIESKIVRVIYSCTEEDNKALNKSVMEKRLYDAGAFWVQEISPENIQISVNRNTLEKTDPVGNLVAYMSEKTYTDDEIAKAKEVAIPIIDEVIAGERISKLTGMFEPIEISVKNYRNYEEETFNFSNITFCTINGKNGAGKSSLFMDAILDCLYEEPREGDLTGWIRADESARSGAIHFKFKIGEQVFRVSRTRAKSGKATLNISELVENEWVNRSAEKYKDTQEEIINILGMDSLTFRSCALIMQDQYGLFLQADKESRMSILSNILGLGMYNSMNEKTRNKLTEANRDISTFTTQIAQINEQIIDEEEINASILYGEKQIDDAKISLEIKNAERDKLQLELSNINQAFERADKIYREINALKSKKIVIDGTKGTLEATITAANTFLRDENTINEKVDEYNKLLEEEKLYLADEKASVDIKREITQLEEKESVLKIRTLAVIKKKMELEGRQETINTIISREKMLSDINDNAKDVKALIETSKVKQEEYQKLTNDERVAEKAYLEAKGAYEKEYADRISTINNLKQKMLLLDDCNCIDIDRAECKFLKDAIDSKKQYEPLMNSSKIWKEEELKKLELLEDEIRSKTKEIQDLNYSPTELSTLEVKLKNMESAVAEFQKLDFYKEQLAEVIKSIELTSIDIEEYAEESNENRIKQDELRVKLINTDNAICILNKIRTSQQQLKAYLELEKSIPLHKERQSTALARLDEIQKEIIDIDGDIRTKDDAYKLECLNAVGKDLKEMDLRAVNVLIKDIEENISSIHLTIGKYTARLEQIARAKEQIEELNKCVLVKSEEAATLEILKKAFSQDGIPHNIVRSILPTITSTANSILGQMTGGKMGMEFRTEKILKSNNKKEVVTLDIFIEEYGKPALPYSSKSGGEKVKSALSAILALAEIKSTSAGIRLGMLFIDEPPFLDGDGIQAYCDALETIGQRYKDIKIMAITHDPTMKARFSQNLDVIKTDSGSKVVFE